MKKINTFYWLYCHRLCAMLLACALILGLLSFGLPVFAKDTVAEESLLYFADTPAENGDIFISLPDEGTGTYTVTIHLQRFDAGGASIYPSGSETYNLLYNVGTSQETASAVQFTSEWNQTYGDGLKSITLNNISPGDTLTIQNVLATGGTDHTIYASTLVYVDVVSTTGSESISFPEGSPQDLAYGDVTFTGSLGDAAPHATEETFLDRTDPEDNGEYSLLHLLNNYNVVSLKDIESTHIVGPIIAQEAAYRTSNNYGMDDATSDLVASDYSRGVSSYVGVLGSIPNTPTHSAFELGYGFETKNVGFTYPNFYTRITELNDSEENIYILDKMLNNTNYEYIHLTKDSSEFPSPNGLGVGTTLQSDDFIDFEAMWDAVIADSEKLVTDGTLEDTARDIQYHSQPYGILDIYAGQSYTIQDATYLTGVNIILPDGYDYFVNPWLPATTINIMGDSINPIEIDGYTHAQFPITYINGSQVDTEDGAGGEFGEVGNRVIWNLPDLDTDGMENRLVFQSGPNVAGHIVAPYAEIWNYSQTADGPIKWEGGNLNGTAVVADFHSGVMEMHMWTYEGQSELYTYTQFHGTKELLHGTLSDYSFEFQLSLEDGSDTVGLMNDLSDFPMVVTAESNGFIQFPSLSFNQAGDYSFIIQELVPADNDGSIDYDLTQYRVTVNVEIYTSDDGYSKFATTTSYYKITDQEGNPLADAEIITQQDINFQNSKLTEGTLSYTFTKIGDFDNALPGATFTITEITSLTDETPVEDGLFGTATATSDSSGLVTFTQLEENHFYRFEETTPPSGYIKADGYWILSVDDVGHITITPMDDAQSLEHGTIINLRAEPIVGSITLNKVSTTGSNLSDATFTVQTVLSLEDLTVVQGGYSQTFTSGADGTFTVSDLPADGVYLVTETSAPLGYLIGDQAMVLIVDVEGNVSFYIDGELDETLTIVNEKEDPFTMPTTGGMGTTPIYLVILAFFAGACLCLHKRLTHV